MSGTGTWRVLSRPSDSGPETVVAGGLSEDAAKALVHRLRDEKWEHDIHSDSEAWAWCEREAAE